MVPFASKYIENSSTTSKHFFKFFKPYERGLLNQFSTFKVSDHIILQEIIRETKSYIKALMNRVVLIGFRKPLRKPFFPDRFRKDICGFDRFRKGFCAKRKNVVNILSTNIIYIIYRDITNRNTN